MTQRKDNDTIEGGSRIKFWGGAVIVLMIILMFMPWNVGNKTHGGPTSSLRGTASGGRKVMSGEIANAAAALELLEGLHVAVRDARRPDQMGYIPLLTAIWGDELASEMKHNPEAYYLLVQESLKFGLGNNPETLGPLDRDRQDVTRPGIFNDGRVLVSELHPLPGSQLYYHTGGGTQIVAPQLHADGYVSQVTLSTLPQLKQQAVYAALADLLSVQAAASLATGTIKPSSVLVDQLIARNQQSFTLQVAGIDAKPFADSVSVPTDDQLKAQLTKYADVPPGQHTPENPFGFGYEVQNAIKFQMIVINRADIRAVVQAEKSAYDWEVEARMAYAKDPSKFSSLAPTTSPTSAPATTSPSSANAFDQIKAGAVRMIVEKATAARVEEIERKIRSTMSLDHQRWAAAKTVNATTEPSSLGVDYESLEYLQKLATTIQAEPKFKVLPTVISEQSRFFDIKSLAQEDNVRKFTYTFDPNVARVLGLPRMIGAPEYLVAFARPFLQKSLAERAGDATLEMMKPSDVLEDTLNDRLAFVRLTDTLASHPATDIEPVRAQLAADVRRVNAQEQAEKKAQSYVEAILSSGKFEVPGTTASVVQIDPLNQNATVPPALGLEIAAYEQFHQEVGRKLLGDPTGKPVSLISVPLAQKVFVVQRLAITAPWNTLAELDQQRIYTQGQVALQMSMPGGFRNVFGLTEKFVPNTWVNVEDVLARNEWKPVGGEKNQKS